MLSAFYMLGIMLLARDSEMSKIGKAALTIELIV